MVGGDGADSGGRELIGAPYLRAVAEEDVEAAGIGEYQRAARFVGNDAERMWDAARGKNDIASAHLNAGVANLEFIAAREDDEHFVFALVDVGWWPHEGGRFALGQTKAVRGGVGWNQDRDAVVEGFEVFGVEGIADFGRAVGGFE